MAKSKAEVEKEITVSNEEELANIETTVAEDDPILELDGVTDDDRVPNLSVDMVSFADGTSTHIGMASSQEEAIAMADEVELEKDHLICVTPVVYFRAHKD